MRQTADWHEEKILSIRLRPDKKNLQVENARAGMLPGALLPIPMHERIRLAKSEVLMHFNLEKVMYPHIKCEARLGSADRAMRRQSAEDIPPKTLLLTIVTLRS